MKNSRARPRVWLNSYIQHKKMVGENTRQVQLGENNENISFLRTTKFRNCSALSIKIALAFDVVRDLEDVAILPDTVSLTTEELRPQLPTLPDTLRLHLMS